MGIFVKGSKEICIKLQEVEEANIPVMVEVEEDMILRRSLWRISTTEALNYGLDRAVVGANNF